jgi:hypothetical protein
MFQVDQLRMIEVRQDEIGDRISLWRQGRQFIECPLRRQNPLDEAAVGFPAFRRIESAGEIGPFSTPFGKDKVTVPASAILRQSNRRGLPLY